MSARAATELRLFDATDAAWIGAVLDLVERSLGEPWRVLLERIEHAHLRVSPSRVNTIVCALRRVIGGRADRSRIARKVRSLVLGHPVLDRDARDARLAAAGCVLGIAPAEVETLLWVDLAKERPVTLPNGRPREAVLAAFANLDRIQRSVRRARAVRLRVWDDAQDLVRTVARYGLLAKISRGTDGRSTVLDVTGPLALFHATTVYGRALAALVPLLADRTRFALDLHCDFNGHQRSLHVEPPLLLPAVPASRQRAPSIADYLARDLADAGHHVEREPPPIASGEQLLFPDLIVERGAVRWWVEVVGFSTAEYLAHKLASYRESGIRKVLLCVDSTRSEGHAIGVGSIIQFRRRIDVRDFERAMQ